MKTLWYLFLTSRPATQFLSNLPLLIGVIAVWGMRALPITTIIVEIALYYLFYGAIYQMNEFFDYERDKDDSVRRLRPLASGKVTRNQVKIAAIVGLSVSSLGLIYIQPLTAPFLLGMVVLNLLYVLVLKRYPYLDIVVVSFTHGLKLLVGIVFVTSTAPFTFGLLCASFAAVCVAIVAQAIKKIGRLDDSPESQERTNKLRTYLTFRYVFLGLMAISLLISSSPAHLLLWIFWAALISFVLLTDFVPSARRLFAKVHRGYSTW